MASFVGASFENVVKLSNYMIDIGTTTRPPGAASPAPWRPPLRPHPGHKTHGNDPICGGTTRPPRCRSSRPRSQAPRVDLDRSRSIEPAQWPPRPPSVGMLDFRWARAAVEIG